MDQSCKLLEFRANLERSTAPHVLWKDHGKGKPSEQWWARSAEAETRHQTEYPPSILLSNQPRDVKLVALFNTPQCVSMDSIALNHGADD